MAEFKPYSITRGGFATPRELFVSVVKDMTQFYAGGSDNAFEIVYPTDISDLDYTNADSPSNDVMIVQATTNVDSCVKDADAEQPWVIRFDTRTSIGHGMGHVNVTTPLQIDWSKPKAPAIPYIPPNTPYEADDIQTEGTLGFIGWRVPDGTGDQAASNERGFINRSIYHTKVTQVPQADEFGNLKWNLVYLNGSSLPIPIHSSRRQTPVAGLDTMGRVSYDVEIKWFELMNAEDVDFSASYVAGPGYREPVPVAADYANVEGLIEPIYEPRKCTLSFKDFPRMTAQDFNGSAIRSYKVSGTLPPSLAAKAIQSASRDENNVPQEIDMLFGANGEDMSGWKVTTESTGSSSQQQHVVAWVRDNSKHATWASSEFAITDYDENNTDEKAAEENRGVEVYDNTRFRLESVYENQFDTEGEALHPREGALNVPMSYAMTVSDHGVVLAVWDQAVDQYETNEGHRFSWFNVQRLVDKDNGAPLVDQTKSFCPLFCVYGVYHEKPMPDCLYFVVRESDVHRPSEEQPAGEDGPDSNAVLNTFEQVAVSEDYEYVITVPSGLTTQRYLYLEEADNIGYTSADVISNGALSEFAMYDEGTCSITGHGTEAACVANGGDWDSTTRLYKGLPATGKFNTGMRMLMRWYGGRLGTVQEAKI